MADPGKEEAIRTLLRDKGLWPSGQGTLGPVHMGTSAMPPVPPARSELEMAGEKMRAMGENFPAFLNVPQGGGYQAGMKLPAGQGSIGGSLSVSGEDKRIELMAQNLGVSAAELRVFLAMRGSQATGFGGSYSSNPLSLSYQQSLPKGQQSISAGGSYALPEGGGTIGAQGTYDIENPRRSSLMGTFSKRF